MERTLKQFISIGLFLSLTLAANSHAGECSRNNAGIGEIVTSILDVEEFERQYGPDWALMDGRELRNKPLIAFLSTSLKNPETGKTHLPDARGKFLRMNNNNASGEDYDPDDQRSLGSEQSDELKSHSHTQHERRPGSNCCKEGARWGDIFVNPSNDRIPAPIPTEETGGAETRPKNISINYFIRVSKSEQNCEN